MTRTRRVGDEFGRHGILFHHDHRILAIEQAGGEDVRHPLDMFGMRQSREPFMQGGRHDIDPRAGLQQQFGLAGGGFGPSTTRQ